MRAIIILTLLLQLQATIAVKLSRASRRVDFGADVRADPVLISDESNFANPGLAYGVCNANVTRSDLFVCRLFMESNQRAEEHLRACDVQVKRFEAGHTVQRSVVALDDDTAVMIPREYNSTSLTFVRFSDCRTRIVEVDYDLSSARILAPLDGVFDIVGVDGDARCFSDCRVIMDFNGSVVAGARKWPRDYQNEIAAMQSPTRGRLLVGTPSMFEQPKLQISAVDDNGEAVTLKTYPTDYDATLGYKVAASTTHQLLSACAAVNLTITCGQFDFTGFRTLETNLTIVEFNKLHSMKVFNLPEGGVLLLYVGCWRNSSDVDDKCQRRGDKVYAKKIDFLGKLVAMFEITQFRGADDVLERMHFFVDEENRLCFSQPYLADGFDDNGLLHLDVVCFDDADLSS